MLMRSTKARSVRLPLFRKFFTPTDFVTFCSTSLRAISDDDASPASSRRRTPVRRPKRRCPTRPGWSPRTHGRTALNSPRPIRDEATVQDELSEAVGGGGHIHPPIIKHHHTSSSSSPSIIIIYGTCICICRGELVLLSLRCRIFLFLPFFLLFTFYFLFFFLFFPSFFLSLSPPLDARTPALHPIPVPSHSIIAHPSLVRYRSSLTYRIVSADSFRCSGVVCSLATSVESIFHPLPSTRQL